MTPTSQNKSKSFYNHTLTQISKSIITKLRSSPILFSSQSVKKKKPTPPKKIPEPPQFFLLHPLLFFLKQHTHQVSQIIFFLTASQSPSPYKNSSLLSPLNVT